MPVSRTHPSPSSERKCTTLRYARRISGAPDIRELTGAGGTKRFVKFPWRLYRDDSNWVPPFVADEVRMLSHGGPFFDHGDGKLFVAERDGEPVGRIAALIDHHSPEKDVGNIGYFECVDDEAVALALFERAEEWLRGAGVTRVRGPISPTLMAGITGILVSGEPGRPFISMPYNPPYYARLYEGAGYETGKELLAYWGKLADANIEAGLAAAAEFREQGYLFRPIDKKNLVAEVERLVEIHNEAYANAGHYAFAPSTPGEARFLARAFNDIVDPEVFVFCEKEEKIIGAVVSLPDAAPVLQALNGRLGPIRLLRALRAKKRIKALRIADYVVDPSEQRRFLGLATVSVTIDAARRRGYVDVEYSWITEDNVPSRRSAEHVGGQIARRYRVYEKSLVR